MIIKEFYVKTEPNGTPIVAAEILFETDEFNNLPTLYAEHSLALCDKGEKIGKVFAFVGGEWVPQEQE